MFPQSDANTADGFNGTQKRFVQVDVLPLATWLQTGGIGP